VPGTTGTPVSRMRRRAETLSPSRRIASGVGPMKTLRALRTASAKPAFSERKP
jgi:hypothetical protein